MINVNDGTIKISDKLIVFPDYSFEQFKHSKFYKKQDEVKIIYLEGQQIIDARKYIVSLFFRSGKIYILSLICCDNEFSERDECKRKLLHDDILGQYGLEERNEYSWGKIASCYDARSNISSIDILYFNNSKK